MLICWRFGYLRARSTYSTITAMDVLRNSASVAPMLSRAFPIIDGAWALTRTSANSAMWSMSSIMDASVFNPSRRKASSPASGMMPSGCTSSVYAVKISSPVSELVFAGWIPSLARYFPGPQPPAYTLTFARPSRRTASRACAFWAGVALTFG